MSKCSKEAAWRLFPIQMELVQLPDGDTVEEDINRWKRVFAKIGYEQAEKDLGWHSVDECLPPIDEDVIVLADRLNLGSLFAIAFGHIVDKEKAVDYNGWNIPGVRYWMPCPKIPEE